MSAARQRPAHQPNHFDSGCYDFAMATERGMNDLFDFEGASGEARDVRQDSQLVSSNDPNHYRRDPNVDPQLEATHKLNRYDTAGSYQQSDPLPLTLPYLQPEVDQSTHFGQQLPEFDQYIQYGQQLSQAPEHQTFPHQTSQVNFNSYPNASTFSNPNNFFFYQTKPQSAMADSMPSAGYMSFDAASALPGANQNIDQSSVRVSQEAVLATPAPDAKKAAPLKGSAGSIEGSPQPVNHVLNEEHSLIVTAMCKQESSIKSLSDLYRLELKCVTAPHKDEMFFDAQHNPRRYIEELLATLVSSNHSTTMPYIGGKLDGLPEGVTRDEADRAFKNWQIEHRNNTNRHLIEEIDKQSAEEKETPAEKACVIILRTCLDLHDCGIPDIGAARNSKRVDLELSFKDRFDAIKAVIQELTLVRSDVVRSCFIPDLVLNPMDHRKSKLANFKGNVLTIKRKKDAEKKAKEDAKKAKAKADADRAEAVGSEDNEDEVAGPGNDWDASIEQSPTPVARGRKRKTEAKGPTPKKRKGQGK